MDIRKLLLMFCKTRGGVSWVPTDIDGCVLWLRSDSIEGLSDGDPVGTWTDQSGLGNNATQSTELNKPLFYSGSPSYVSFGGTNHVMTLTNNFVGTAVTICGWVYINAHKSFNPLLSYQKMILASDVGGILRWYFDTDSGVLYSTPNVVSPTAWQFIGVSQDAAKNVLMYIGTTKVYDAVAPSAIDTGAQSNQLGCYLSLANWYINSRIDQVAVYNAAFGSSDFSTFYDNTKSRYGL